ncbi:MAG: sodium/proton-translocating pyrophosphatase [Caldilineales bacterium]
MRPFLATAAGVLPAIVIDRPPTTLLTEGTPVLEIKRGHDTGPATTIPAGLGAGMEAAVYATLVIAGAILASILIYQGERCARRAVCLRALRRSP